MLDIRRCRLLHAGEGAGNQVSRRYRRKLRSIVVSVGTSRVTRRAGVD